MMQISNPVHSAELTEKIVEDEGSTTEEENSIADVTTSEDSDITREKELAMIDTEEQFALMIERKQEALRLYGERFGIDRTGTKLSGNRPHWNRTSSEAEVPFTGTYEHEVLADMDRDLQAKQPKKQVISMLEESVGRTDMEATFGYAGSLDENPPFAKFDIRDSICIKVGGFKHGQVVRDRNGAELVVVGVKFADGAKRLWFQPQSLGRPGAGAFQSSTPSALRTRFTLIPDAHVEVSEMKPDDFDMGDYSDGEEIVLCHHCRLPVGQNCYKEHKGARGVLHAECLAQALSKRINEEEQSRKQEDAEMKKKVRTEYNIGWRSEEVPRNMNAAMQLGCDNPPQGMCAIVYDEDTHSMHVAPTLEPAEAVNLEYLSLALQVRVQEGREPLFSLDPVDPQGDMKKDAMQEKRYEPEWLAGTSVGEVLFQADYHLKELSLGEYEQPVLGMKNCNELCDQENSQDWDGREWFVVKKAEVQMTESNTLVPRVKMGVEAREIVLTEGELLDKPVTRPDHPLVKYAGQFSHYFDLIAERKSAIYHLRDLAKASVLAKMLVETNVNLQESWFSLGKAGEIDSLEVPQLWNMRTQNHFEVTDNKVVAAKDKNCSRGLYGGVEFGLSAQSISVPGAIAKSPMAAMAMSSVATGRLAMASSSLSAASISLSMVATTKAAAVPPMGLVRPKVGLMSVVEPPKTLYKGRPGPLSSFRDLLIQPHLRTPIMPGTLPIKPSTPLTHREAMQPLLRGAVPQGVDLNLDGFNLSQVTRTAGHDWSAANDAKSAAMGDMFWAIIDGESSSVFQSKDENLLKAVFNPALSDRREEGEQFVPPETSFSYVQHLRGLVREEEAVRKNRKHYFLSTEFSIASPGSLFPQSWAPSVAITSGKGTQWHARPDYKQQSPKIQHLLKSNSPAFDKSSEDGIRFRIYQIGNLEVRTTQSLGEKEIIGAVYSKSAPKQGNAERGIAQDHKVKKVTEFIARTQNSLGSYIVLETEKADMILSESLRDGSLTWEENPTDLEDRNSLAKVVRSAVCSSNTVTVGHMKNYQNSYRQRHAWESQRFGSDSARSSCKRYAQAFYVEASADMTIMQTGFAKPRFEDKKWRILEHDDYLQSSSVEETRMRVGHRVQIWETGRVGEITDDDHSAMPYKVAFADGGWPLSKWYKECDLQSLGK